MSVLIHQDNSEDTQYTSSLVYKLKWLMIFRVILVTILLGSALIIQIRETKTRPLELLYLLIIVSYVFTIVAVNFLRKVSNITLYAYLQIVYDVFLETGIVYITGGLESVFTFPYIFTIISASILLFRKGAFLAASLSTILYSILVDLQFYRILPLYGSNRLLFSTVNSSTIYYNIFVFYPTTISIINNSIPSNHFYLPIFLILKQQMLYNVIFFQDKNDYKVLLQHQ